MASTEPTLWVYKNNAHGQELGNSSWGNWNDFLRRGSVQPWGGSWMTNHNGSLKILREEIQKGDRVLCWQTDKGVAVGTAIVAKIEIHADSEELFLRRERVFARPVPILELRRLDPSLAEVRAFRPGGGTLFETSAREAKLLLAACDRWQDSRVA